MEKKKLRNNTGAINDGKKVITNNTGAINDGKRPQE